MKTFLKELFVVSLVVTAIFGIGYLVVSNNLSLFVSNGTYSLVEFLEAMDNYIYAKDFALAAVQGGLIMNVGFAFINFVWNLKIGDEETEA